METGPREVNTHVGGARHGANRRTTATPCLTVLAVTIAGLVLGLSLLPRDVVVHVISVLTAWLMLSVPIGIVIGHCVLDDCS